MKESPRTWIFWPISGGWLGHLKLGDSLEPAQVVPEISGEGLSLERVSGGGWEQTHLATRLATAEVLSEEERQMVVLDDVISFTDTGRMARAMATLEEAAQHLQVIIPNVSSGDVSRAGKGKPHRLGGWFADSVISLGSTIVIV